MNLVFGSGPTCRGFSPAEDYAITLTRQTVTSSAGGTPGTLRDAATLAISGATVDSVFSVRLNDTILDGTVVTNLTPGVATFSGGAVASWVANGIAKVQAVNATYGTRLVTSLVQRVTGGLVTAFNGYQTGSLAKDIVALITGATGSSASFAITKRFSALSTNTRNASAWFASILNDTGITREPDGFNLGALIGPKHILFAAHVGCSGQKGFVGSDGVGYVATVVSTSTISGTDIGIAYLRDATAPEIASYNAAYPSSKAATAALSAGISGAVIKPLAMLPASAWALSGAYLCLDPAVAALANAIDVPIMHVTTANAIGVWEFSYAPHSIPYTGGTTFPNEFSQVGDDGRASYSLSANVGGTISGDISLFAIPAGSTLATNNASLGVGYPILLGCQHGSDGTNLDSPWVSLYITQITTAMQALAQAASDPSYATYAPIQVSLTGYSTF